MSIILTDILPKHYVNNIPNQIPVKATQGFVATATFSLIVGCTAKLALFAGALAATATLVEAVTRPIIRRIFEDNSTAVPIVQACLTPVLTTGLATTVAPWMGVSYTTRFLVLPILTLLFQDFSTDIRRDNQASAWMAI